MNINAATFMNYTYTGTKAGTSKKQEVSYKKTCENVSENISNKGKSKEKSKEYKNVVKEFKQRHPESAAHVDEQVRAGKNHIRNCGADNVSRSDMTMEEYKAFFKGLMDKVPYDCSQMNNTEIWSITEEGWEQMKNDSDYEAWVLGYTVENRSVHFPFQTSTLGIEKFGASIEEHIGQGIPKDTQSTKKANKKDESWWYKRHTKMQELLAEQEINAQKRAVVKRKAFQEQWVQKQAESSYRMQQYFAERISNVQNKSTMK